MPVTENYFLSIINSLRSLETSYDSRIKIYTELFKKIDFDQKALAKNGYSVDLAYDQAYNDFFKKSNIK